MTVPYAQLQKLNSSSSLISLYTIDATAQGGSVYRITNETGSGPRRNLLNYSQASTNAAWLKVRTSASSGFTAPDGSNSASKLTVTGTTAPSSPYYYQTQSVTPATANTTYTFSAYLKAGTLTYGNLRFDDGAGTNTVTVTANLSTGVLSTPQTTGGTSNASASILSVGNGWYRVSLTCTWASITTVRTFVRCAAGSSNYTTDLGFTPSGTQDLLVWGVQLESGSVLTPYQYTSTVHVSTIAFGGVTYMPFPIQVDGIDYSSSDSPPTPKVTISNVTSMFLPELVTTGDLVGATFTRIRVLSEHLDGQPGADASMYVGPDVFLVAQKVSQNRTGLVFQLKTSLDRLGLRLPRRQILVDKGFPAVSRVRTPG